MERCRGKFSLQPASKHTDQQHGYATRKCGSTNGNTGGRKARGRQSILQGTALEGSAVLQSLIHAPHALLLHSNHPPTRWPGTSSFCKPKFLRGGREPLAAPTASTARCGSRRGKGGMWAAAGLRQELLCVGESSRTQWKRKGAHPLVHIIGWGEGGHLDCREPTFFRGV